MRGESAVPCQGDELGGNATRVNTPPVVNRQGSTTKKEEHMPNSTEPKATAKETLSTLKGDLVMAKADVIEARRNGNTDAEDFAVDRVLRLKYAIAAVSTFKHSGKSALKAAASIPSR